jgi:hypothetical protein
MIDPKVKILNWYQYKQLLQFHNLQQNFYWGSFCVFINSSNLLYSSIFSHLIVFWSGTKRNSNSMNEKKGSEIFFSFRVNFHATTPKNSKRREKFECWKLRVKSRVEKGRIIFLLWRKFGCDLRINMVWV